MEQRVFSQDLADGPASLRPQYAQAQPAPSLIQALPMQQVGVAVQPVYQMTPVQPVMQILTLPTSALASASLVLGLLTPALLFLTLVAGVRASESPSWLSFVLTDVLSLLCAMLAIVFGHMALHEIHRSVGRLKGSGLAVIGLCIGYLGLLPALLFLLVASMMRW